MIRRMIKQASVAIVAVACLCHVSLTAPQDRLVAAPDRRAGEGQGPFRGGRVERVGGIRYTIKDGIVYEAKKLLADVAAMVEAQKKRGGTSQ